MTKHEAIAETAMTKQSRQLYVLGLVIIIAFSPILNNQFVNWDDNINFSSNYNYRELSLRSLKWAFTTTLLGVYQPLAWIALEIQYSIFGDRPIGYHLVSLMLHIANCMIIYMIIQLVTSRWIGYKADNFTSLSICLLYAVHPLRVEVVAWASCQPYLLSSLFLLISIYFYIKFATANYHGAQTYCVSLILFSCSLFSKSVSIGSLSIYFLIDLIIFLNLKAASPLTYSRAISRLKEKAPFLFVATIVAAAAITSKSHEQSLSSSYFYQRFIYFLYSFLFYIYKTTLPNQLCAHYPIPSAWDMATTLVIGGAVLVAAWRLSEVRVRWLFLYAIASYGFVLAPVSGLIPSGNIITSDRYSYISCISLSLLMFYCTLTRIKSLLFKHNLLYRLGVSSLVVLLVLLTRQQCRTWRSSVALWNNTIACSSGDDAIYNSLGAGYLSEGEFTLALKAFEISSELIHEKLTHHQNDLFLLSRLGSVYSNIAIVHEEMKNYQKSLVYYNKAIEIQNHVYNDFSSYKENKRFLVNELIGLLGLQRKLHHFYEIPSIIARLEAIGDNEPAVLFEAACELSQSISAISERTSSFDLAEEQKNLINLLAIKATELLRKITIQHPYYKYIIINEPKLKALAPYDNNKIMNN